MEVVHAEFRIDLKVGNETEKIEVMHWQFPLHGMLRTYKCLILASMARWHVLDMFYIVGHILFSGRLKLFQVLVAYTFGSH